MNKKKKQENIRLKYCDTGVKRNVLINCPGG